MQAAVAIIVAVLASPVITSLVGDRRRCDKCRKWEVAYWELRRAAARGEYPPDLPKV